MKLKKLLEGYAWERKSDGSLPTLADAIQSHSNTLSELASVQVGTDTFTVTADKKGGVNVQGGTINNNYSIKVDAFIDIPVEIKDVSMVGNNVKIKAAAMGMEKEGMLDGQQLATIIDNIESGQKEFKIAGTENTFIFTQS